LKLLFDQNISHRAVKALQDVFDCAQVRSLGLENKTDIQIWDFAKVNGYSIVSFDADFRLPRLAYSIFALSFCTHDFRPVHCKHQPAL
jgi:predicted nuclease of predicted toxin-antitoxin system